MSHRIPPAPGPGEAPVFEKRMDELREQLEQGRGGRPRWRERPQGQPPGMQAPAQAQAQARAGAGEPFAGPSPADEMAGSVASPPRGPVPVQPETWEEPYGRPPRRRPSRRRPEREERPHAPGMGRLVAVSAAVSFAVSAVVCLVMGGGDGGTLVSLAGGMGWSL